MPEAALPYLSEHQGAPEKDAPHRNSELEYSPSDEEKRIVKKIEKMYHKAKIARSHYDAKWPSEWKMFRGNQWDTLRPSYRASEVFNFIFQIIQSQVPILTDSRPKFEYLPRDPQDREFAEIMNDIAANDWEQKNFLHELTRMLYTSHIHGTAISWLGFDPEEEDGIGGICFKPEELYFMFPDPDAADVKDADYFVRARVIATRKLKRKYPRMAKHIKPDATDLLTSMKNEISPVRYQMSVADKMLVSGANQEFQYPNEDDKSIEITCYYRDSEICEEEKVRETEDGGSESYKEQRIKYPLGRKTVISNNIVLEDGSNEYEDGRWPWAKLVNYISPDEFWGISEIEQTEGPQKILNKLISFCIDVLMLTGNPIWIVDTDSGVDTDNLTSAPGLVVEKNRGSEVRRESGVQLQPYVLALIDKIKEWVDQISGAQDITRGVSAPGVTAAAAISDLQNAAQTRIRQKARNIDTFLQRFGEQYAARVMQFYTAPQVFRVTNDDGSQRYFKAHMTKDEDGKQLVRVERLDPDSGMPTGQLDEYVLRGKLDLAVTTGTSLPFSKDQKRNELFGLYDRGLIDGEEVLKGIEYPNYQSVLERVRANKEAAAEAAASQAA